jgi:hypothetical protein
LRISGVLYSEEGINMTESKFIKFQGEVMYHANEYMEKVFAEKGVLSSKDFILYISKAMHVPVTKVLKAIIISYGVEAYYTCQELYAKNPEIVELDKEIKKRLNK